MIFTINKLNLPNSTALPTCSVAVSSTNPHTATHSTGAHTGEKRSNITATPCFRCSYPHAILPFWCWRSAVSTVFQHHTKGGLKGEVITSCVRCTELEGKRSSSHAQLAFFCFGSKGRFVCSKVPWFGVFYPVKVTPRAPTSPLAA